jgi:hypothetical protein
MSLGVKGLTTTSPQAPFKSLLPDTIYFWNATGQMLLSIFEEEEEKENEEYSFVYQATKITTTFPFYLNNTE